MRKHPSLWRIPVTLGLAILTGAGVAAGQGGSVVDPALQQKTYLFEIVRHLYRWYLDETDIDPIIRKKEIAFLIRPLQPELDPGDRSRYAAIVIPDLNVEVMVKRADYTIEELGITVRSDTYKIVGVSRTEARVPPPPEALEIVVDYETMRDYLFRTRNEGRFPEGELLTKMRHAVRRKLMQMGRADEVETAKSRAPVVHFAPLSPIANEAWAFIEDGKVLIRCASDLDLENPAVWDNDDLAVDIYEIDKQTVVSLDEVAGSNAYLTRDQVGRALFNCIILGKRIQLDPLED